MATTSSKHENKVTKLTNGVQTWTVKNVLLHPHQQLFPIQRLPLDVLSEIFWFCLPGTNVDGISSHHAPLLLCSICSSWRTLAISMPRLWQTFRFDSRIPVADMGSFVNFIHIWLRRAGTLPLTIRFNFFVPMSQKTEVFKAYEALSEYAPRWESFDVFTHVSFSSWPKLNDTPILQTLDVRGDIDGVPFTSVPRLTSLSLSTLSIYPTEISCIPWHQLKRLYIGREQTRDAFMDLIQSCCSLEELSIEVGYREPDTRPPNNPPIRHPTLRNMHIAFFQDCRVVLDSLTLPALTDLSLLYNTDYVDPDAYEDESYSAELVEILNRSKCKLQALSLINSGFEPDGLLQCLQHKSCQTLSCLTVINTDPTLGDAVDEEIILQLTYAEDCTEPPLCPKLVHLTLESCCSASASSGFFGPMVWSRRFGWTEDSKLESLWLTTPCVSDEDCDFLARAEADGLRFHFRQDRVDDYS